MNYRYSLCLALLLSILALPVPNPVLAADNAPGGIPAIGNRLFSESAFITGMGTSNVPEGHYQPVLLIWHLGMDMKRYFPTWKDRTGSLSFFIEPQVNPVFEPETDFEAGVGLGMQYRHPLAERLSLYVLGMTGPHYISVKNHNQANGFIFASAVGGGFYYALTKDSAITVGYRFRHMSNAGIENPNGGIDNHFAVVGYSLFF